eukprot:CAMPEP_0172537694 /NCGR_PEP_ID=MMETSP1067-20121228/9253_1 /TAXON_ID=265564 ORGANISM="Thalassiosira punctigera, Strain Tpunct2005C2" /NCGR_SAMPLE_ID=MMETSP1067 /ASSEMBLY_ACC=CAM_ASM_000444 /LENGTH=387 /DNA_ID=CAMNT_0013323049 /DNA_START=78 /DNA_END=1242 /DNA_ORIENTATION=-
MSDSDDDIYASDNDRNKPDDDGDDNDKDGVISGGLNNGATKRSRRASTRNAKSPKYKDESSSEDEESDDSVVEVDDDDEEEEEKPLKKRPMAATSSGGRTPRSPKKKSPPPPKFKSTRKSPSKAPVKKEETPEGEDDEKEEEKAEAAAGAGAELKPPKNASNDDARNEGIDVVIPHSLLTKHQGTGRNECTMLVQVESNDDTSHHLDFHGQSGAIGRFEADDEGVTLDLKGYQYRGTIRPGPTAMVVALTRDGQFKVEAITDEFVTLDANTKTDVMAKLDAVVRGDMDETYRYREENVNANAKRGRKGDGEEEGGGDDDGGGGKKRAATTKGGGGATKRRKTGGESEGCVKPRGVIVKVMAMQLLVFGLTVAAGSNGRRKMGHMPFA